MTCPERLELHKNSQIERRFDDFQTMSGYIRMRIYAKSIAVFSVGMRHLIAGVLAFALYAPLACGQDTVPLDQAIKHGKVEALITGLGGSTGDAILITVRRKVPDVLRLTLAPGTVFMSALGTVQNMAGASIKGERVNENSYRPATEIMLVDNDNHSYVIEAYCLDFHKGNPGRADRFSVTAVDGSVAAILTAGKSKSASIGAIQAALWMFREGLSPAQVQARFSASTADIAVARSIIRESVQDPNPQLRRQPNLALLGSTKPTIQPGDIVVTLDRCVLQNGRVITNLPKDTQLRVIALNGDWVGSSVLTDGKEQKGWIKKGLVAKVPEAVRGNGIKQGDVVVTLENTTLRLGQQVLAQLPKDTQLQVKGVDGSWVAVTVVVAGRERRGWVERRVVTIANGPPTTERRVGDEGHPTPHLFETLALIAYDFGAKNRGGFRVFGEDFASIFSVFRKDNGLEISAKIPDVDGQLKYRGMVWTVPTQSVGVNPRIVSNTARNGWVWTARVERIGETDVTIEGEISSLPTFDFGKFTQAEGVVQFANGYAVNLFGAIIEDASIVKAGSEKTYLTDSGRKLYGRVISKLVENGRITFKETILR